jgi:hypothetical protein
MPLLSMGQGTHSPIPITEDEVLEALLGLNNGKADASPHTGIPNELLKYGGRSMAKLLMPLFTAVWGAATHGPQG